MNILRKAFDYARTAQPAVIFGSLASILSALVTVGVLDVGQADAVTGAVVGAINFVAAYAIKRQVYAQRTVDRIKQVQSAANAQLTVPFERSGRRTNLP